MSSLKLIAALLVATVLVVFGAQNTQAVTLHFLMLKLPSAPLVLALFGAMLLGTLLGWIVSVPGRFRGMRERRGLQGRVKAQVRDASTQNDQPVPSERSSDAMSSGTGSR
jgi:uncharacterized integral membrane protein